MSTPVVRLAMHSMFGRTRALLLYALPVLLVVLALLVRSLGGDESPDRAESLLFIYGLGIVVPVVALLATTTLINSELDDGSILYLLTKPLSRVSIVASKVVVVLLAVLTCGALPLGVAGYVMVGTADHVALAGLAGGAVAGVAYTGIFTALMTVLQRSVIAALLYWLVLESTLASLLGPARWLSARSWGSAVLESVSTVSAGKPDVPVWYALLAAPVALVAGVLLAARRLSTMTLSDE
ncbi:ABC transporter permease subunit [Luteipulveratus sp. YIM 133132]|uniref:ABC transporter permease subunit n=1 Tax=Luteipulveratus flavus TaxID=3031728 RepID=A0ABT6CD91_9MICO|nr:MULTISPECIES: ABC transporter permease subunit [unclassified Luteipulveratus]MDE9364914.1 ABC transporter permease subunit [Luteipulveratus sp. YIM 133132]MDF8266372.1 ABC transporter permease subunit [Luteipulveratus sp. YIM 133296]